ncbi:MAG: hypothetical protein LBM20_05420 [Rikenellaceae bacterium]|jgi:hypothetical protein|nr:hypothetical protein [Rikenellaceae bacterium]
MNKLPVYYPGSSVVVMFRVRNRKDGSCVPLEDYNAEAAFYTRLLGRKVSASGLDPGKIAITAVNSEVMRINLSGEYTAKLPCGACTVKLTLTHKSDGSRLIVTQKIFTIQETIQEESHDDN